MYFARRLLLILLALWLPVQATAAATLSVCRHTTEPATVEASHCLAHASPQSVATPDPEREISCDNCALCHLASAAFLTSADTWPLPAASKLAVYPIAAFASHIPAPPQQPPRR
jgi:hypothetical protein